MFLVLPKEEKKIICTIVHDDSANLAVVPKGQAKLIKKRKEKNFDNLSEDNNYKHSSKFLKMILLLKKSEGVGDIVWYKDKAIRF